MFPVRDVAGVAGAGAVTVLYGSPIGLTEDHAKLWTQDSNGILDSAESADQFGGSPGCRGLQRRRPVGPRLGVPFEDGGERDKVWRVVDDETFKCLTLKAQFLVDHLRVDWLTVGEAIPLQVERASKVTTEFAFVH